MRRIGELRRVPWWGVVAAATITLALTAGLASSTHAATLTVTDFGDTGAPGQLRTLINAAAPGDTIVIPPGTITLPLSLDEDANATGDIDISKDLIIQGVGADRTAIVIAGGERVFDIFAPATVTISNITIRGGFGSNVGGGGGIRNAGTLTLTDVTVSGNTAPGGGGGIANTGTMTLINVTVSGNTAPNGGGIFNGGHEQISIGGAIVVTPIGGTLSMTGGVVSNNTGGGIFNVAGTATLTDVTISGNTAISGIRNVDTMTLTNVTVSGNTSSGDLGFGGGILNIGTLTLTNVTVSGNIADQSGGGIANLVVETGSQSGGAVVRQVSASTLTMINVTVIGNTPGGLLGAGCSGLDCEQGSIYLTNTIMANNLLSANCSAVPVTITSLGHNLDSGTSCDFTGPGDLSNTDPLLGPLANNGGPTQTHALLVGSPAIDAGTNTGCPSTDQRGVARPQGVTCDIGAFELATIVTVNVRQFLNVATFVGPTVTTITQQRTFRTTDPIVAGATYYDSAEACAGVAPAGVKFFVFNQEGQLILGRNRDTTGGVGSTPVAVGSKTHLLRADLASSALPPGAYNLVFWVKDCTNTFVLVSDFYAIEVLTSTANSGPSGITAGADGALSGSPS